jgi:hypothetical protein
MITGIVLKVVWNDHGFGEDFLNLFTIVAQLRNPTTCAVIAATTVARIGSTGTGRFCFANVPEGDYILYLHRPGYVARTLAVYAPAGDGITSVSPPDAEVFDLLAGDVTNNNIVDTFDISLVKNAFTALYPNPPYQADVDFNADAVVDTFDLSVARNNFSFQSSLYSGNAGCYQA